MLDRSQFFIKEHAGLFKTRDVYDILDPETQEPLGRAEEAIGGFKQFARWFINKKLMSTTVECRDADGHLEFSIYVPVSFFRAKVQVLDPDGEMIGYFKSKLFSLGGGFWVYDTRDRQVAEIKGNWVGWNFQFLTPEGEELGVVTKKWAGLAKEMFTSADNYMVSISEELSDQTTLKRLLLAAALAIDVVYKENQG